MADKFIWPIGIKAHKNFLEKMDRGRIQRLPIFLGGEVFPIISGTGKATDFKFGGYIYRDNPYKSLLKISEKRERGRIQGLPKFLGTPYYPRNG